MISLYIPFLLHIFFFLHWGWLLLHLKYLFVYLCLNDQLHFYLISVTSVRPFVILCMLISSYWFVRRNEE